MRKKFEWIKAVRRIYPPFYTSLIFSGYRTPAIWKSFLDFPYVLTDLMEIDAYWFYPSYHIKEFAQKIALRLFADKNFFQHIKKESLQREQTLRKSVSKGLGVFFAAYSNYMPTLGVFFICDDLIEGKVRELLLKCASAEHVEELMKYLTTPLYNNFNAQEQLDLCRTRDIAAHIKKYQWLHARYGYVEKYTPAKVKKTQRVLLEKGFIQQYTKEQRAIAHAVKEARVLLGTRAAYLIEVMRFFIYYRTQRTDIMALVSFEVKLQLEHLAHERGISYDDLLYCTLKEVRQRLPSSVVIAERKKQLTFVGDARGCHILIDEKHHAMVKRFLKSAATVNELKGKIAYEGLVRGFARVIIDFDELDKVKKGEVLITNMTTPNMVPAMRKTVAFVTNEGGITCHAAIMARELKKPCIIGTKIATQVIKTGDMVEVDAVHGVVKIIKRG
ncbi:MAG: Phosphoenolpyruvate synthase/pyruvate phosphate dikinase [Candidatus Magasanikbacteria bacterium GW2011_GWA2_45_39]|uniref:Phosphoenolpyruvate synthase/pyruvate phosphate dikinase n=2 Tax=Candidatus Magasanikiibacteriota TaxID=1752731 RepID=A0A0G1Q7T2_9BACT|nr:MAG: Phosphoenolpyruvate synthase/pyruvate phosphate dikinase [Candidatus Magasanikbacteria bacterium GW2011_GWA2_45_39]KKU13793.1 MAG: Phosphoenolpyruvate synthase/pyruvate phosphate dikinase [Candidatus Magasanikbacteria bacterium GW2011_GWC2_45_8]HBW74288.1 hypothetical protein [Candidatus Magasanikbacteria bacterium]